MKTGMQNNSRVKGYKVKNDIYYALSIKDAVLKHYKGYKSSKTFRYQIFKKAYKNPNTFYAVIRWWVGSSGQWTDYFYEID